MKNIVIVGTSRGIGFELVKQLSKEHNVFAFSRNIDPIKQLKQDNLSLNINYSSVDISNKDFSSTLENEIKRQFDHVDILINNAGVLINKPALELTHTDIQTMLSTNLIGLVETCQVIIPFMLKDSHIVNIGSMGGFQGSVKFPGLSIYSASKAAVASFSECLAEELKEKGIKVNCLALGSVQTEMLETAFPDFKSPISAKEMAEFIGDFSLKSSKWLNGKVIPVSITTP